MPIYINDELLETFKFPGGECHFNISKFDLNKRTVVTAYLYNSDDIMCLLLLKNAIIYAGAQYPVELVIPYLPYARQDRVCNKGEPFSLEVILEIIRSISKIFMVVTFIDIHSDRGDYRFLHERFITQADIIKDSILPEIIEERNLTLIAPDKGAVEKTFNVYKSLVINSKTYSVTGFLTANKVRDPATGRINSTEIEGDIDGKNFIIIDDICDGGSTFTELAKVLKEKGAKELYLYVTHGIFSKGLAPLKEFFKHVYCYHTFIPDWALLGDEDYLTILKKGP